MIARLQAYGAVNKNKKQAQDMTVTFHYD